MNGTINRVRAVLRLISPDDITPMGVRMIEKVLDAEMEVMKNQRIQVATHVQDLEPSGLPVGTRIVTNHGKIFELDQIETVTKRSDAGQRYWIEPGTLQPFHVGLRHWLPAYILPAPVKNAG
jgi:hypothetical protein